MAGVKRSQFTENMKKDMYDYFIEAYPTKPSVHEMFFEIVPSDAAFEQFTSAVGLGKLLRKPEGDDFKADSPMEGTPVVTANWTYGRVVRFSYESVEDSQKISNMVAGNVATWSKGLVITKEEFYASFFNKGAYTAGAEDPFNNTITGVVTDSSGDFIYDGKPFFATDHPNKVGDTYSNFNSSSSLSAANLKAAYLIYTNTNNRDERGNVIALQPSIILINPALKFTAQEILNSSLIPNSQDNTTNVLASIVQPVEWSYFTDTDAWVLGQPKSGLMATQRETPTLDFYQDETNLDYFATIRTRFGGSVTNFRFWWAANLPTS